MNWCGAKTGTSLEVARKRQMLRTKYDRAGRHFNATHSVEEPEWALNPCYDLSSCSFAQDQKLMSSAIDACVTKVRNSPAKLRPGKIRRRFRCGWSPSAWLLCRWRWPFAISSESRRQAGLYCAIVTGFVISAIGGSKTPNRRTDRRFVVVVAGIIAKYGIDGLFACTMMAG